MSKEKISEKNIVLLGPLPPPHGGVATYLETLYSHLKQENTTIWAYGQFEPDNKSIFKIEPTGENLLRFIKEIGMNTVVIDSSSFFIECPQKIFILKWLFLKQTVKFKWLKIIHKGSMPDLYNSFNLTNKIFARMSVRNIDHIITVNPELEDWFHNKFGPKINLNYISSLLPAQSKSENKTIPSEINHVFQDHKHVLCSIGIFSSEYGFDHTANVVEKLRNESQKNFQLILIDGGYAANTAFKEGILNNRPWIHVFKNIDNSCVSNILEKCKIFIRDVKYESFGLSRVEALWAGIPVIATNVGVTKGITTHTFGDEERMYQNIVEMLNIDDHQDMIKESVLYYQTEANNNLQNIVNLIDTLWMI